MPLTMCITLRVQEEQVKSTRLHRDNSELHKKLRVKACTRPEPGAGWEYTVACASPGSTPPRHLTRSCLPAP